jgi:hypothetical protein
MNVANLQIEGLMMAVAAVNDAIVQKGLLSVDEIDVALRKVEASLTGDERLYEDMSPANRDAVCYPVRLLMAANRREKDSELPRFSALTKMVGQTKQPYNDQQ